MRREKKETTRKTHRHAQHPLLIMPHPQALRLIPKLPRPIDARAPRPVTVDEVAALDHEVLDDAVELGALVALRAAHGVLGLTGAELAEVLGGARHGVGVQLHFDAAEGFAAESDVEEDDGVLCGGGGRHSCGCDREVGAWLF